jgi:hypothetical protein
MRQAEGRYAMPFAVGAIGSIVSCLVGAKMKSPFIAMLGVIASVAAAVYISKQG